MGFDIKINDKVVETVDVDPALVDYVLINESIKVPSQTDESALTIRVILKSATNLEYVDRVKRQELAELEEEQMKGVTPQDNPVAVALEEEFGATQGTHTDESDTEMTGEEEEDDSELGSVSFGDDGGSSDSDSGGSDLETDSFNS